MMGAGPGVRRRGRGRAWRLRGGLHRLFRAFLGWVAPLPLLLRGFLGRLLLGELLRAVHVDAGNPGSLAAEDLYLGGAAGVARGAQRYDLAALRQRVGDVAVRVAGAADEALAALAAAAHYEVVAALGALAQGLVRADALPDDVRELRLDGLEVVVDAAEHVAGLVDDGVLGDLALRDRVHALLELGGHLVGGYLGGEVREGLGHLDALLRRHERVVVDVAAIVEVLDDVRTRRLGAEPEVLHNVYEAAGAVAARRLGLLGVDRLLDDLHEVAFLEVRYLFVGAAAVGVDAEPPLFGDHRAARGERLAAGVEAQGRAQGLRRTRERGEEAADDELVDLPLVVPEVPLRGVARRVDRGVVRRLLLAPRRLELVPLEQLLGVGASPLDASQVPEHLAQVERFRVDGVIGPRVGDVAVRVEVFGEPGRPRGAVAEARRGRQERRGVERGRRGAGGGVLLNLGDGRLVGDVLVGLPDLRLGVEAGGPVAHGERLAVLEVDLELPVGHGDERAALLLALGYEHERRRLDAADG